MAVMNRRETTKNAERALAHQEKTQGRHDRARVVELARKHTERAIQKLVDLMDGKGGKVWVLDKAGALVQIDVEVSAAVQADCATRLIERGYGKAPQAILIADDTPEGRARLGVHEKIAAIQRQREGLRNTTDLEASQIIELPALEAPPEQKTEAVPNPQDLI